MIERYLSAVRNHLPSAQRDDIVAELADSIRSDVDERELILHRSLTDDETSTILKSYGHPLSVAGAYRNRQVLIGPRLLPFYLHALKNIVLIVLVLAVVGGFVNAAGSGPLGAFLRFWGTVWAAFFITVGVVTVVFALLERVLAPEAIEERWDPRSLPLPDDQRVSRLAVTGDLASNALSFAFALDLGGLRSWTFGGAASNVLHLTPVWQWIFLGWALVALVLVVLDVTNLLRPDWKRLRDAVHLTVNVVVALAALVVLQTHDFIALSSSAHGSLELGQLAQLLNGIAFWSFVALAAGAAVAAALDARKLLRRPAALERAVS